MQNHLKPVGSHHNEEVAVWTICAVRANPILPWLIEYTLAAEYYINIKLNYIYLTFSQGPTEAKSISDILMKIDDIGLTL